jgi:hypothetical protein
MTAGHAAAVEAVRRELGAAYAEERARESDCMRELLESTVGEADARVAAAEAEAAAARAAIETIRSELGAAYADERARESDCMRGLLEGAVGEADARVAIAETEAAEARAAVEAEVNASVRRLETLAEEARRALAAQRAEMGAAADRQVSQYTPYKNKI